MGCGTLWGMDPIAVETLQYLAPFGVMIFTLAGLLVYARLQGVNPNQLSTRDLDEQTARQFAGPRVVGSVAIILLIVFKWMNSQLQLMTFVAMPLILLALVWHTLLVIRIRKTTESATEPVGGQCAIQGRSGLSVRNKKKRPSKKKPRR